MIGVLVLVVAMTGAAVLVGTMVLGGRETPPFGLSLRVWGAALLALAVLGIVLLVAA